MHFLLQRMRQVPSHIAALEHDEQILTYGELLQQSATMGARLNALASPRPIGICLEAGAPFLAAVLAAWSAALTPVLLDPRLPEADVRRLMVTAGARFLITETGPRELEAATGVPPELDAPGVIQHTSGTSGPPKLMLVSEPALRRWPERIKPVNDLRAGDRLLSLVTVTHAYGFQGVVIAGLYSGTTLVISEATPRGVLRRLERGDIDHLYGTPFQFDLLVRAATGTRVRTRTCLSAGAPLPPGLAAELENKTGLRVRQCYGSTELGGIAWAQDADDSAGVGPPLPGVQLRAGEGPEAPAPVLVLGSSCNPDLPAEWVDTGDLGYLQNGQLYLCGRSADLINVAGLKVYPAEVEAILRTMPGVQDALVCPIPVAGAGQGVGALLVGTGLDPRAALHWCRCQLADYKVPQQTLVVPELPRTANGKPDRRAGAELFASPAAD